MYEVLIFWLVLLILCIGIEVLTLGLTTIWFAGGALVAIFANLLYAPIFLQIILFFVVSLVLLFFTRPIAVKYFNKDRIKTNVESMVGRQAIVTEEIDNMKAVGQVTVNGQEWTARSWDERVKISEGEIVAVKAISGVKLIVEKVKQSDMNAVTTRRPVGAEAPVGNPEAGRKIPEPDKEFPQTEKEILKPDNKLPETANEISKPDKEFPEAERELLKSDNKLPEADGKS